MDALKGVLMRIRPNACWAIPIERRKGREALIVVNHPGRSIKVLDPQKIVGIDEERIVTDIVNYFDEVKKITRPPPITYVRPSMKIHGTVHSDQVSTTLIWLLDLYLNGRLPSSIETTVAAQEGAALLLRLERTVPKKIKPTVASVVTIPDPTVRKKTAPHKPGPRVLSPVLTEEEDALLEDGGGGFSLSPAYNETADVDTTEELIKKIPAVQLSESDSDEETYVRFGFLPEKYDPPPAEDGAVPSNGGSMLWVEEMDVSSAPQTHTISTISTLNTPGMVVDDSKPALFRNPKKRGGRPRRRVTSPGGTRRWVKDDNVGEPIPKRLRKY